MKFIKGIFKFFIGIFAVVGGIVSFNFFKKVAKEVEEDIRREEEEIRISRAYLDEIDKMEPSEDTESEKEELEEVK